MEAIPPPVQKNYGLTNPLLKNSDFFFCVVLITIRYKKLFGLDAFYEIMIRQERIWQFCEGGCVREREREREREFVYLPFYQFTLFFRVKYMSVWSGDWH